MRPGGQGAQGRCRQARPGGMPWPADPAPRPGALSSGLPRGWASPHPRCPRCPPRGGGQPAALWAAVATFSSFDSGPASLRGVSLTHLGAEHHFWLAPPGRGASRSPRAPSRGPLGTRGPLRRRVSLPASGAHAPSARARSRPRRRRGQGAEGWGCRARPPSPWRPLLQAQWLPLPLEHPPAADGSPRSECPEPPGVPACRSAPPRARQVRPSVRLRAGDRAW